MNKICGGCKNISTESNGELYCKKANWVEHEPGYGGNYTPNCLHDDYMKDLFEPIVDKEKEMKESSNTIMRQGKTITFQRQEIWELEQKIDKLVEKL